LENWDENVKGEQLKWFSSLNILKLWDLFYDRNVLRVATKTDGDIGRPCVDTNLVIHHVNDLIYDEIEPRISFPESTKKVLAVGAFPAEFFDIFPDLVWYEYDYAAFVEALEEDGYDFSIIGTCIDANLKLNVSGTTKPVYCYQPSALSDRVFIPNWGTEINHFDPLVVLDGLKTLPIGTDIGGSDPGYAAYNNRLWVYKAYSGADVIERDEHIFFCNGWALPQHLLKEGLLEM
jgi:hypothetical protein